MKLSKLLANFGELSKEQYLLCRDAGFSQRDLIGKNQSWFDQNKSIIKWADPKQPPFENQIATLGKHDVEIDIEINYSLARHAMRELAIIEGTDTVYLEQIAIFKKQNEHRNAMKKQKRAESKANSINRIHQPLADLDSEEDQPEEEKKATKEFFESLNPSKRHRP